MRWLALAIVASLLRLRKSSSMPEVEKRDDQDQGHEDGHDKRDADKPRKHELSFAGAGRRFGNTYNVVKSPE
jgi:hypothetical protein